MDIKTPKILYILGISLQIIQSVHVYCMRYIFFHFEDKFSEIVLREMSDAAGIMNLGYAGVLFYQKPSLWRKHVWSEKARKTLNDYHNLYVDRINLTSSSMKNILIRLKPEKKTVVFAKRYIHCVSIKMINLFNPREWSKLLEKRCFQKDENQHFLILLINIHRKRISIQIN